MDFVYIQSEKILRSHKRYTIVEAPKDGVRFCSAVMEDQNQEYLSLKREYSSVQGALVADVLSIAGGYSDPILSLNCVLAQLDVLASYAHASAIAPTPYVRPIITPRGKLVCSTATHVSRE